MKMSLCFPMLVTMLAFTFIALQLPFASCYRPSAGYGAESLSSWTGWGGNIFNNRWASGYSQIPASEFDSLSIKCRVTYQFGVSATPVIDGNLVYFPTWNGSFVALDYTTCSVHWTINVTQIVLDFAPPSDAAKASYVRPVSHTSPQVDGDVLYFGTLLNCLVVALDKRDGSTLAVKQINSHPVALASMSPTFYGDKLFIGSSSFEETTADVTPNYKCCSYNGNMVALSYNAKSKSLDTVWNVSMIPPAQAKAGWSGSAVWGSQPAIDIKRGQVIIATGNTYSAPQAVLDCQTATQNLTAVREGLVPEPCLPTDVWQEAVLAIDMQTGLVNWVRQLSPLDSWTLACGVVGFNTRNKDVCPGTPGIDADFGMAPAFVPASKNTPHEQDTVVVGQKNGNLYGLSAQAGTVFWTTATGPDGTNGGLSWGIAVDDSQVYFTQINSYERKWQLQPSNETVHGSAYGAACLADGRIVWETATPGATSSLIGVAYNPPTVVGGVVLVGKTGLDNSTGGFEYSKGALLVLDKASGKLVHELDLDANFHSGIAVQGEYVMWGTGYRLGVTYFGKGLFSVAKVGK